MRNIPGRHGDRAFSDTRTAKAEPAARLPRGQRFRKSTGHRQTHEGAPGHIPLSLLQE